MLAQSQPCLCDNKDWLVLFTLSLQLLFASPPSSSSQTADLSVKPPLFPMLLTIARSLERSLSGCLFLSPTYSVRDECVVLK
jgi:hypothetical protein